MVIEYISEGFELGEAIQVLNAQLKECQTEIRKLRTDVAYLRNKLFHLSLSAENNGFAVDDGRVKEW